MRPAAGSPPEPGPGNAQFRHGVFPIPAQRVRAGPAIKERDFMRRFSPASFGAGPCRRSLRFGRSPCLRHPGPCPGSPGRFQRRRQRKRALHDLAAPLPRPSSRSRLGVPALHDPARLQVTARGGHAPKHLGVWRFGGSHPTFPITAKVRPNLRKPCQGRRGRANCFARRKQRMIGTTARLTRLPSWAAL